MSRKILIDIDNTLTFLDYTLRSLEDFYKVPKKEIHEIYDFNLNAVYGIPEENHKDFWNKREEDIVVNSVLNEQIYKNIVEDLTRNDDIYIVTARAPELESLTRDWLIKNNIYYNELHCIGKEEDKLSWSNKKGISFDRVYEDNPKYLMLLGDTSHTTIVDYPYNRNLITDKRLFP